MVAYLKHADVYYSEPQNIWLSLRPVRELLSGAQTDSIGAKDWERIRRWFVDNGQTRESIFPCLGC